MRGCRRTKLEGGCRRNRAFPGNVLQRNGAGSRLILGGHDTDLKSPGQAVYLERRHTGTAARVGCGNGGSQSVAENSTRPVLRQVETYRGSADWAAGLIGHFHRDGAGARPRNVDAAIAFQQANLQNGNLFGGAQRLTNQESSDSRT
jgi:hypothetical protein